MSEELYAEKKALLLFLIFVLAVAAFHFFHLPFSPYGGLVGIIAGLLGLFRLFYLNENQFQNLPKILNTPAQILFGLKQQQHKTIRRITARLSRPDILIWFTGGVLWLCWAIFCTLYPLDTNTLSALHGQQESLLGTSIKYNHNAYGLVMALSSYGVMAIIIFMALSYSQSRMNIKWALSFLLPFFAAGAALMILSEDVSLAVASLNLSHIRGSGLRQAAIFQTLSPDIMAQFGTGLFRRYIETGAVGALLPYVIFLPGFFMTLKSVFHFSAGVGFAVPVIGVFCAGILALCDLFYLQTPVTSGIIFLGMTVFTLCWGAAGRVQNTGEGNT